MPTKTYFVDHINNCRYPLNGVIPSGNQVPDIPESKQFTRHIVRSVKQLPPVVDLRPFLTPVEQQATANSCVANALAGAYEYMINKSTGNPIDISRLFVYYNARYRGNPWGPMTDSGCLIYHAVGALSETGTCLESLWPYDLSRVNVQPSAAAYQSAKKHTIVDWLQVKVNLNEMKSCLAQGYPFVFGVELFNSFGYATQGGVVPMPSAAERDPSREWNPSMVPQQHRFHAMLAVGYSDRSQVFLVRNSWGAQWGDQGYCYMPYAYLSDPALCFDPWIIRKLATDDFSQDGWSYENVAYPIQMAPQMLHSSPQARDEWEITDVEEPDTPPQEDTATATAAATPATEDKAST